MREESLASLSTRVIWSLLPDPCESRWFVRAPPETLGLSLGLSRWLKFGGGVLRRGGESTGESSAASTGLSRLGIFRLFCLPLLSCLRRRPSPSFISATSRLDSRAARFQLTRPSSAATRRRRSSCSARSTFLINSLVCRSPAEPRALADSSLSALISSSRLASPARSSAAARSLARRSCSSRCSISSTALAMTSSSLAIAAASPALAPLTSAFITAISSRSFLSAAAACLRRELDCSATCADSIFAASLFAANCACATLARSSATSTRASSWLRKVTISRRSASISSWCDAAAADAVTRCSSSSRLVAASVRLAAAHSALTRSTSPAAASRSCSSASAARVSARFCAALASASSARSSDTAVALRTLLSRTIRVDCDSILASMDPSTWAHRISASFARRSASSSRCVNDRTSASAASYLACSAAELPSATLVRSRLSAASRSAFSRRPFHSSAFALACSLSTLALATSFSALAILVFNLASSAWCVAVMLDILAAASIRSSISAVLVSTVGAVVLGVSTAVSRDRASTLLCAAAVSCFAAAVWSLAAAASSLAMATSSRAAASSR